MRPIDADALLETMENFFIKAEDEARYAGRRDAEVTWNDAVYMIKTAPTIEPERKAEELLPDGTLHLFTDTDLSKVNRVWVSQNGTHYGDLYYVDGEPKIGKWIPHNNHYTFSTGETSDGGVKCSSCGFETHNKAHITFGCPYKFCPNCRSYNGGEANE